MKIKKDFEGIIDDMSNQDYHDGRSHLSSSVLKTALKDPKLFYSKYVLGEAQGPEKYQSAFDFGTYVHALILEPHTVETDFAIFTGSRRQGKEWEHFKFDNRDKIILTSSQVKKAGDMMIDFAQTEVETETGPIMMPELFEGGVAEQSFFCKLHGMNLKARFDYSVGPFIRDVKTTSGDVSTAKKARQVSDSLGYDLSAALYVDVYKKITGENKTFQLVFLCKTENRTVAYQCSKDMIDQGREKYLEAIRLITDWKKTGIYYSKGIQEI